MIRYLLFTLCLLLLGAKTLIAIDIKDEKALQSKLELNRQKINRNKAEIAKHKSAQKSIQQDLMTLERNIVYVNHRLTKADTELSQYNSQIAEKEASIAILSNAYRKKTSFFQRRLVQIYKNKNIGPLEFMFYAKDFGSLLDYSYFIERILKKDVAMISEIKNNYELISKEKKLLSLHKERVSLLKTEITQYKKTLSGQQKEKSKKLEYVKEKIEQYEKENAELLANSNQIAAMIQQTRRKKGSISGTGKHMFPVNGWISSGFGLRLHPLFKKMLFHTGVDIASAYGTEVKASDSGTILYVGGWGGYGNVVIIDHGNNLSTVYAHLSRFVAQKGENIKKGALIGYVGSTGYSTGPHLHFEVRINGKVVDPIPYLQ